MADSTKHKLAEALSGIGAENRGWPEGFPYISWLLPYSEMPPRGLKQVVVTYTANPSLPEAVISERVEYLRSVVEANDFHPSVVYAIERGKWISGYEYLTPESFGAESVGAI